MLKLQKIAVTGGLASGKTTACRFFKELGAYVVSADQIVHQLLSPETDLGKEVISLLGDEIVRDEKLDRGLIAERVFCDLSLLKELEKRIHPEVQKVIETHYKSASQSNYPLFVAEVPLLFESGGEKFYDYTIFIFADEKTCHKRFADKGWDKEAFEKRSQRFLPMEEKKKRADFVIENNGTLDVLYHEIQTIFNFLKGSL